MELLDGWEFVAGELNKFPKAVGVGNSGWDKLANVDGLDEGVCDVA